MNRRSFVAALPAATLFAKVQAQQPITHVDTNTTGDHLRSSVVPLAGLTAEGAAPGAKAYVNFNGPTNQLAALAAGSVTLEPGAQPHPPHRHPEEEVMIVGEGTGEFFVEGIHARDYLSPPQKSTRQNSMIRAVTFMPWSG